MTATTIKYALICAIIVILGFGLKYTHDAIFQSGWDARQEKLTDDINKATSIAVEKAKTEWEKTNKITAEGIKKTNETKKQIDAIVRDTQNIKAPLCPDVGDDFTRMYNSAVDAIQTGAGEGGSVPTDKVPSGTTGETTPTTKPTGKSR